MKKLFFGENQFGNVTDLRFLELELGAWLSSPRRIQQLLAERYYRGDHDIKNKVRTLFDRKGQEHELKYLPNNKIVNNLYAKMVDQITNFEMGQPITFDTNLGTKSGDDLAAWLSSIFGKQTLRTLKKTTRNAVSSGISWLYVWPNAEEDTLDFSFFPAHEVLPFWADAEHKNLDCALRYYVVQEYDENGTKKEVSHVEVFDGNGIHRFIYNNGSLEPDGNTPSVPYLTVKIGEDFVPYNWTRSPLIPFRRSILEQTLLSKCKSNQDALNRLMSDFLDAVQENTSKSTLVIKNYDGTDWDEFIHNLISIGLIPVRTADGGDGGVEVLEIKIDTETYRFALEQLKKAIIENCGGFDAKDDRLGSNPNQMNIESMYADIEITANDLESEFAASFEQVLWFVKQYLKQTGKCEVEDSEKADVIFNRDMMINESEVIENCNKSVSIISRETILKNHSWVDDPKEELKRLEAEEAKMQESADIYGGTLPDGHGHGSANEVIEDGEK